ncbi:MAG: flagellar hook-basal body complex protein FliE [Spirochaetota bacterium]
MTHLNYLSATQVNGHELTLARTDPRHYAGRLDPQPSGSQQGTFASMLLESLEGVNAEQQTADSLAVQAIVDPDNVNPHDVTIAAAKANLSLSITKSVVDRVIQAYREIQNVR